MIRPIVKYPEPSLEEKCVPVEVFDEELKNLARDMLETMYAAPGIGLAAPQVGVNIRLIVLDPTAGDENGHQMVLVNPEVVEVTGRQKEEEGCLSLPGLTAVVERPFSVRVKAQDLDGNPVEVEGANLMARLLCHEIDHLDGVLYLQHLSALKRDLLKRRIRKLIRNGEW
ncbi:MAG: peptide deformylase [Acidobacteriota bacterium]|nr:MAG: peptide deformylase [Acidobacteriota bacterium]